MLDDARKVCACFPKIVEGIDDFQTTMFDKRAFREFFDRIGEAQGLLTFPERAGDAAVVFNFVRDVFGVEFVNQGTLEDAVEFNESIHRATKTVRRVNQFNELISERDAFDILATVVDLGFEHGLSKVPKAGVFPLYHANAIRGIGRAWQDAGINKTDELATRLATNCTLQKEEDAWDSLEEMKNFNGIGWWARWWKAISN